eukprot:5577839-Pleurochrysis_carterae.AAC.3
MEGMKEQGGAATRQSVQFSRQGNEESQSRPCDAVISLRDEPVSCQRNVAPIIVNLALLPILIVCLGHAYHQKTGAIAGKNACLTHTHA